MLNEVRIFKLRFNYSYPNLNAGNSIFVFKGENGLTVDDIVYCGGGPPAACHLSHWAEGGRGGR